MEPRKLYRLEEGKMLCGVCAGLADYLNLDVTVIRLLAVLAALCSSGIGLIFYLAAAIIMPLKPV